MWIRKAIRDMKKGVDSPMPTQVVSNEEFEPRPQTEKQKHVEQLIGELSEERAKKLGMKRRDFMRSSMGLATCFLASNLAYGKNYWDVDEAETWEAAAYNEKWPKNEYFIIDVQAHFTNGVPIRGFRDAEFVKNMGFQLKTDGEAYSFKNFVKEPIAVPKGSRIECLAHHDNSAANKFNPDPTITVRWGDQTWEEMMIGWLDYTIDGQNLRAQGQTQTASK